MTAGAGNIATDLACAGCGYNLRTQPRDGACPECGRRVADTLASLAHGLSPRAWALLARGTEMLWLAAVVAIATGLDLRFISWVDDPWYETVPMLLRWSAGLLPAAMAWWGTVLVARALYADRRNGPRQIGAAVALVFAAAISAFAMVDAMQGSTDPWFWLLAQLPVDWPSAASAALSALVVFGWLSAVMRRARRPWLARQCLVLAVALPVSVIAIHATESYHVLRYGAMFPFREVWLPGLGHAPSLQWVWRWTERLPWENRRGLPMLAALAGAWAAVVLALVRRECARRAKEGGAHEVQPPRGAAE